MENASKRDWSIDFIRILSCMMVVLAHTAAESWYSFRPDSYTWTVLNFYDSIARPSIPLFVMISGYLFLRKEQIDYKKLWRNNILHIIIVYVFWVLFYAVVFPGLKKSLSDLSAVREQILGLEPHFHLWYLRILFNIYAIVPLIWTLVHHMDKKLLRYFLILFLIFGILRSTVRDVCEYNAWIRRQISMFGAMELVEYTGYFILGYVLTEIKELDRISDKKLFLTYLIAMVLAVVLNQLISLLKNEPVEDLYGGFSLPVMVEAVCLFLLAKRRYSALNMPEKTGKWVRRLSESTLFIYLIHPFVIRRVEIYLKFYVTNFNVLFSVPVFAALVFVLSAAAGMVVRMVPVFRKIC